jgi:hypothetical protein
MKAFLTMIALAATAISFPAHAGDIGCEPGDPSMASAKATSCQQVSFVGPAMITLPTAAYAFAPPRFVTVESWANTDSYSGRDLIDADKDLEGGVKGGSD